MANKTQYELTSEQAEKAITMCLDNAYQSNIKQLDESYLKVKSQRSSFSKNYYKHYPKLVRE